MSEKTTKELVLEGRDEGKVVFLQYDGDGVAVLSAPIDEFIKQPADGILYDLNRLEEIALTYMDDPKWVNDFAVALTIRALHKRVEELETDGCGQCEACEDFFPLSLLSMTDDGVMLCPGDWDEALMATAELSEEEA